MVCDKTQRADDLKYLNQLRDDLVVSHISALLSPEKLPKEEWYDAAGFVRQTCVRAVNAIDELIALHESNVAPVEEPIEGLAEAVELLDIDTWIASLGPDAAIDEKTKGRVAKVLEAARRTLARQNNSVLDADAYPQHHRESGDFARENGNSANNGCDAVTEATDKGSPARQEGQCNHAYIQMDALYDSGLVKGKPACLHCGHIRDSNVDAAKALEEFDRFCRFIDGLHMNATFVENEFMHKSVQKLIRAALLRSGERA